MTAVPLALFAIVAGCDSQFASKDFVHPTPRRAPEHIAESPRRPRYAVADMMSVGNTGNIVAYSIVGAGILRTSGSSVPLLK